MGDRRPQIGPDRGAGIFQRNAPERGGPPRGDKGTDRRAAGGWDPLWRGAGGGGPGGGEEEEEEEKEKEEARKKKQNLHTG